MRDHKTDDRQLQSATQVTKRQFANGKVFAAGLLIVFMPMLPLRAQVSDTWLGHWWLGMIEDASLPLNISFDKDSSGDVAPVLYSPMQKAEPIRPSSWAFSNDSLSIQIKSLGIKMTLRYEAYDSSFSGRFKQGLLSTHITFRPSNGLFEPRRPQEPQQPFPYIETRLILKRKVGHNKINIGATLTVPGGADGNIPCVLLVSGSGMQNRDEELLGHKPFWVLSDYLARNGIASLRYDDRGTGESTGDVASVTTDILADDAEWIFDWLCKQKHIDRKRIGIIGHSEGGVIAPIIASRNRNVAFIVLLAGPGVKGSEILRTQNRDLLLAKGVDSTLVERRDAFLYDCFEAAANNKESDIDSLFKAYAQTHSKGLTKPDKKKAGLTAFEASQMALQMRTPWMRRFLQLDPTVYLKRVRCPVLAMNGEKDLQVSARENLAAISRCVNPKLLTVVHLDGLNHLFQHCNTGLPSEYLLIEETFSPEALDTIAKWILGIKN